MRINRMILDKQKVLRFASQRVAILYTFRYAVVNMFPYPLFIYQTKFGYCPKDTGFRIPGTGCCIGALFLLNCGLKNRT